MSYCTLFLFTNNYPNNIGEEYLDDELHTLSKHFKKICIFPANDGLQTRSVAENTSIISTKYPDNKKKLTILIANIGFIIYQILIEFITSKNKKSTLLNCFNNFTLLLNQLYRIEYIKVEIKRHSNIKYYSYWTNDWSILLAILKKKKIIDSFISRIHGYDLFEERFKLSYIPFRNLQFSQCKFVVSISNKGKEYLQKKYSSHKKKFSISYLGVKDNGIGSINNGEVFNLVSCSRIDENKRVYLIALALSKVNFKVNWIHFGDGNNRGELEKLIKKLPDNIQVSLKGHVSSNVISIFYKETPVDLFINVSISEGLPVSLMEAISFGIPIMATDVGGSKEIVNSITGVLLPPNPTPECVANEITKFNELKCDGLNIKRQKIKKFWMENFSANKNYMGFYNNYLR